MDNKKFVTTINSSAADLYEDEVADQTENNAGTDKPRSEQELISNEPDVQKLLNQDQLVEGEEDL